MNNNHYDKILNNYIKTIIRFKNIKIPKNDFLKNPYIENYLIDISNNIDNYTLINKILNLIEESTISNEDVIFILNYYINISKEKKNLIYKFLNNSNYNIIKNKIEIVLFSIKYFRFYLILNELIFENKDSPELLYFFIFLLNESNQKNIEIYLEKYLEFQIFYSLYNDIKSIYIKIFNFLIKYNLIENVDEIYINNCLIKIIFQKWLNIYLKDVGSINLNKKIENFLINKKKNNKSIFSKFICSDYF